MKRHLPWIVLALVGFWLMGKLLPGRRPAQGFDVVGFSRLPVLVGGRVMPMDTLARLSLAMMNHHGAYEAADGRKAPPTAWLLDATMRPERADGEKVFEVTHPDVRDLLGWSERKETLFSFDDFRPFLAEIQKQADAAAAIDAQTRNSFQRAIIRLRDGLLLYLRLKNSLQPEGALDFRQEVQAFEKLISTGLQAISDRDAGRPFDQMAFEGILQFTQRYQNLAQAKYVYAFPFAGVNDPNERWKHIGGALLASIGSHRIEVPVSAYAAMVSAYRTDDPAAFNAALRGYTDYLGRSVPGELSRPWLESWFNGAAPFLQAMTLYVLVFVLAILSWLVWTRPLARTATLLLLLAFVLHTAGLGIRMYLQGRPPVTNLYSSAIFVGWGAVALCLILERFYRNGIGLVCAATSGFVTLLIAYNLQTDGDSLEMLRAVLDTNVWLATHVVCEALGYSSTFLAGLLGIIYILRGLFTSSFSVDLSRSLGRMMYGIVCFATLFSLVGTILGGIWADQSWGRFWGWDPKENGALLVVIWNAIILHARWGGYVRERGIAVMAVFGGVVTSLSWWGTNLLGVGLHSYGFTEAGFGTLMAFVASQLAIMGVGLIPTRHWRGLRARSRRDEGATVPPVQTPAAVG